jgi:hypothetical protein
MTEKQERYKIKMRMAAAGITAGAVIRITTYTNFRGYLNGARISNDRLSEIKQALTRLESK